MKINTLHINLYKSIKKPLQFEILPVNILIGQNNCGKSNILYAIDYLFDVKGVSEILDYPEADIEAELEFSEAEQEEWGLPERRASLSIKNGVRKLHFPKTIVNYQGEWQKIFSKNVKHLNYEIFNDFEQIKEDWRSFQKYKTQLAKFRESLKVHFPKVVTKENALDINYDHAGIKEGQRRATIDHLGSGFRRIFTTLLYIYHPEYQIVIIDEPETHLHPVMIKKLLWAMQNAASGQVLFTTHSPLFINSVTLPQVLRVVKDRVSTTAFGLPIKKQHYSYKRLMQELDADNVEMFFADKVVLVEGVSDRILLRGLIDRFYQGDKDIKVVQTHGKGNFNIYLDLLNIFQIEYLLVADKDLIKYQLDRVLNDLQIKINLRQDNQSIINELKNYHIFVFPNGSIEKHYPQKYQRDDKKPINALYAATAITQIDFNSNQMRPLKEIINSL
ncbi:AAA family ATPase [Candidatus Nomurabacteria bacterium]|nr:AAA family ATPase [Candidatus Nomurabacteria bacterium]